jgi:hypothetical protein
VPVLDLAELVRAKVHDRLERMNGELEALVAAAVDEELDRLVAAELAERTNGGKKTEPSQKGSAGPVTSKRSRSGAAGAAR